MPSPKPSRKPSDPEFEGFITAVNALYKDLTNLSLEYRAQLDDLQRLVPNQGAILVSRVADWRDVDDFQGQRTRPCPRDVRKAEASLDRWANDLPTDGQRPMPEWAEAVKGGVQGPLRADGQHVWNVCPSEPGTLHRLGKQVRRNELIFTDVWVDRDAGFDGHRHGRPIARVAKGEPSRSMISSPRLRVQVFERIRYLPQDMLGTASPRR